jgi:hypothetical protein
MLKLKIAKRLSQKLLARSLLVSAIFRSFTSVLKVMIPILGEVNDLKANHFEGEGEDYHGRTRGVRIDAYKQERDLDAALDQAGITNADQDVEISRASGVGA